MEHNYFADGIKEEIEKEREKGGREKTKKRTSQSASLPIHDDGGSAAGKHLILGARAT